MLSRMLSSSGNRLPHMPEDERDCPPLRNSALPSSVALGADIPYPAHVGRRSFGGDIMPRLDVSLRFQLAWDSHR